MSLQGYTPADLARLRSVSVRPAGWSHRIKPKAKDGRHPVTGERIKVILDEVGNRIRMRQHGQDVHVTLPHIRVDLWTGITEEH
ncbi:hypothetical protein [Planomonospora venezuelensis]|uniref:Uncharacterized protein n=1 Tax=Planomonospora venezuelensis TaxID=1999 RepID=A0A841D6E3_PLAVE|nr:hypothetical protein [Planomonospora venezuelensis]MBB5965049.1 hypothetical protein [Planomonospora venezuelensis]GIN05034.1 hypothetical protein Pve01_66920 [Planomonospora venezuelensis]